MILLQNSIARAMTFNSGLARDSTQLSHLRLIPLAPLDLGLMVQKAELLLPYWKAIYKVIQKTVSSELDPEQQMAFQ